MATGRPPFMNKSHHKLGILIRTAKIIFPDPERHKIFMSAELKDIILKVSLKTSAHFSLIVFVGNSCSIATRRDALAVGQTMQMK